MEKLISSDGNINLKFTFLLLFKKKFLILAISLIFSIVYIGLVASKKPLYNYSISFNPNYTSANNLLDQEDSLINIVNNIKNIESIRETLLQIKNIENIYKKSEIDSIIYKIINQIKYDIDDMVTLNFIYEDNDIVDNEFFDKLLQNSYLSILNIKEKNLISKKEKNTKHINDLIKENAIKDEYELKKIDFEIQKIKNNHIYQNKNKLAKIKEAIKIAQIAEIYEPTHGSYSIENLIFNDGTPLFMFGVKILTQVENNIINDSDGFKDSIRYQDLANEKKDILEGNFLSSRSLGSDEAKIKIENLRLVNQINYIYTAKQKFFLDEISNGYITSIKEVNKFKILNLIILQLVGIFFGSLLVILYRIFKDNS